MDNPCGKKRSHKQLEVGTGGRAADGGISFNEPNRKRAKKEEKIESVPLTISGRKANGEEKSLFASYVSPFLQTFASRMWSSIGGSTDDTSSDKGQTYKGCEEPPVLGLTDKLLNQSEISLREPH